MGKTLKKFPHCVLRQDIKSCRGDRRCITSRAGITSGLRVFFMRMQLFAAAVTLLAILIALLLAFLTPVPRDHLQGYTSPTLEGRKVPEAPREPCQLCRPRQTLTRHHGVVVGPMETAPLGTPPPQTMEATKKEI